ncbi:YbaN family protein [Cereibacter sphaeroides]|uniref:YbaN family protein n=1 Tax=Rhodobacterales TaxID=204455 RepID=UPI000BBEE27D|nr:MULTISPECIES: YbaN family protein [Paracoccaceae]MCE6952280.1 YbaN family protein [Cereibacter sphaeroides]MCE6961025.1 YbaN family protein [Cereibacter sphaeroides]MCE6969677.1 YbaN family protein [Cereibacter sphaeroides]MCE6975152.1 YbaN family protein [Cereibacter sphaeroides]
MHVLWLSAGLTSLALGLIGIFLPLLPTVPFLLLAAFCFARSSERLHGWLVSHPVLGPPIQDWERSGAISRRGKQMATVSMLVVFGVSVGLELPPAILAVQAAVLCATGLFIWTRPSA